MEQKSEIMFTNYKVIVVGAGHAGCEAAAASANMGAKTLLITLNMHTIAQMSCNPAMGGIAKGQIVREIDALGGYSGIVTDESMLQFRMLNKSKGPAMWSPRAQSDRVLFAQSWRQKLESLENLHIYQDDVKELLVKNGRCVGVKTGMGHSIAAEAVVVTSGTFLNGIIHIGEKQLGGGRIAERASSGITEQLVSLGFEAGRLKTGTPPRIDGRSIDYSKLEEQQGDREIVPFSFLPSNTITASQQVSCHIAYTNADVHSVLELGFDKSPMYQGRIQGSGPRYCPSIEDKITRFADRDRHQLFVEPEGRHTIEVYLNGFSSSLPEEVQIAALRKVEGFSSCRIFRPGYAIEYDYFPPTQLTYTLQTKQLPALFLAGQINGTTGYEEAACQGLIAGINAASLALKKPEFKLGRHEAYIGVLIDDLINKGTDEPYRMFTSRAEYRTLLRQDNADLRLTKKSFDHGLASQERYQATIKKEKEVENIIKFLHALKVDPEQVNPYLSEIGSSPVFETQRISKLILRPGFSLNAWMMHEPQLANPLRKSAENVVMQAEIQLKYEAYIQKEKELAGKMEQLEDLGIPLSINYSGLSALSAEARQKFEKIRPQTLGQASRISGVNPTDIQILMVHLGR